MNYIYFELEILPNQTIQLTELLNIIGTDIIARPDEAWPSTLQVFIPMTKERFRVASLIHNSVQIINADPDELRTAESIPISQ